VGQTVGFFMGNVVFLTLQSKDFANKWIRSVPSDKGLVEFDGWFSILFSIFYANLYKKMAKIIKMGQINKSFQANRMYQKA
jgi:hypothetical protein